MKIQEQLLDWYTLNHRALPFREDNDAYRIWISEVMLQQTQVSTVIPYYNRFMDQYPTIFDLAKASEEDVYKLWEGLGYYSRARNLLKCAREIVTNHRGEFPRDYKMALKLPGVGPYTAGAVLSIAYNLKHPAVDGNVMRVISRIYNITEDIALARTRKLFEAKVQSILPDDARHFNQALMELGALVCTPKNPDCIKCPVKASCQANLLSIQKQLPVKTKKVKNKTMNIGVGILIKDQKILLIKNHKGLLAGLWGLPIVEGKTQKDIKDNLFKEANEKYNVEIKEYKNLGKETHIFTHRTWKMTIYQLHIDWKDSHYIKEETRGYEVAWADKEQIKDYAISTAFQKVLNKI